MKQVLIVVAILIGWAPAYGGDALERYGAGLDPISLSTARIAVYRCLDNQADRMRRGVIARTTRQEALEWCIQDYLRQYQESVNVTEKLIEGIVNRAYPNVGSPAIPKQREYVPSPRVPNRQRTVVAQDTPG